MREALEHGLSVEDVSSGPATAWRRRALRAEAGLREARTSAWREAAGAEQAPWLLRGDFVLHSGDRSDLLLDLNAWSDADVSAAAGLLARLAGRRGGFRSVTSVPRGGDRLAAALEPLCTPTGFWHALADDVYTTGASLHDAKLRLRATGETNALGLVLVARREPPAWVLPLLRLDPELER